MPRQTARMTARQLQQLDPTNRTINWILRLLLLVGAVLTVLIWVHG